MVEPGLKKTLLSNKRSSSKINDNLTNNINNNINNNSNKKSNNNLFSADDLTNDLKILHKGARTSDVLFERDDSYYDENTKLLGGRNNKSSWCCF